MAHRVSENDIYNGYFIPKGERYEKDLVTASFSDVHSFAGATVIGNTWYGESRDFSPPKPEYIIFICLEKGHDTRRRGLPGTLCFQTREVLDV